MQNEGYSYSDFAVLVRLNALTFPFEEKFLTYNISHRIFGGFKFYERAEIKNLISYLRLFLNPRDDISFLRIINFPKRGIGDSAIKTLTTVANENETSLMNVVLQSEKFDLGGLAKKIENFKKIYVSLLASYEDLTLSNFVENVIKQFDIKSAYSSGSEEDLERQLNINTFVSAVQEFEKNNPSGTLLDFLESVTLVSDIDTMDDSNNAVTIATIHSVKGLEFRYVFIVGLEEKIFPISRAYGKDEDMEEERRLMYVAITRAKENLMLTRCRTRFLYGRREFEIDSRFLKELGLSGQEKMSPQLSVDKLPKVYFSEAVNVAEKPETKYSYNPFAQKTKYEEYIEKSEKKEKNYVAGQTVSHPKFGTGKVLKCDDMFVDIEFEKLGIKTLVKEIAPLEIVE